jgi:MFS family permease
MRSVEALAEARRARLALPRNVRALSWVSFANDAASELAYPVVPLFLTVTLGAPVAAVGLIEGVAEGIAVGLRGLSGWLSDRWGERRLPWVGGGYGGSAAGRVLVAAALAWGWVLAGRAVDRLGKGARTAPRDALIRDSTPAPLLGAAFGYHRALDTAGAVVGPLSAVVLLAAGLSFRGVLWVAVAPGFVALLLLRAVREARRPEAELDAPAVDPGPLPRGFWMVLVVWLVFSLGNSSDVFLLLRAKELGLGTTLVVLAYALYNLVYASLSWPLGALSDRRRRDLVIGGGLLVFGLVYLGFSVAPGGWAVWPLLAVYGCYVAATDGVAKAWVADQVPGRAIGTAYGIFSAASGSGLLIASIAAGLLWSHVSPAAPFVLGASAAGIALVLVVLTSARSGGAPSRRAAPPPSSAPSP